MSAVHDQDKILITSLNLEMTNMMLGTNMSQYRKGQRFLDIGAGVGSVACELGEDFGMQTVAIDIGYSAVSKMLEENAKVVEAAKKGGPSYEVAAVMYERGRSGFIQDFKQNPYRYIAADARSLPFRDRSFDLIHSCMMLDLEQSADRSFAHQATSEALRVLDRGGKLVVGPGHRGSGLRWHAHENIQESMQDLAGKKDKVVKRNVNGSQVLVFEKK